MTSLRKTLSPLMSHKISDSTFTWSMANSEVENEDNCVSSLYEDIYLYVYLLINITYIENILIYNI